MLARALVCVAVCHLGGPSSARALTWTGLAHESVQRRKGDFPTPDRLEPAVRFWEQVFGTHDIDKVVLHDRQHLDVVWEVVTVPLQAGEVDGPRAREAVKAASEALRTRLVRLEADPTPIDDEDRWLLALAGERLAGAAERLRAQGGIAGNFRRGLQRSRPWLPAMRDIFAQRGLPEELVALAFVESTFNPDATSADGAAGVWQLMPQTARELGLHVSWRRDERRDVRKATRAAADMLGRNHKMLSAWPLAITAYNHGPSGIRRATEEVGSTDLMDLVDHYEKRTWGFASKNFYAEFHAVLRLLERAHGQALYAAAPAAVP